MRLSCCVAALSLAAYVGRASAQELAFGSETWRGHAVAIKGAPMSCRAFSHFGNGDRLVSWRSSRKVRARSSSWPSCRPRP